MNRQKVISECNKLRGNISQMIRSADMHDLELSEVNYDEILHLLTKARTQLDDIIVNLSRWPKEK